MRMDEGWERSVGEVAIWRLTTHFTFRDFIPRTNKLPIYTTPIRLCNGQEKKCPREGKKCCIRVHELNRMELSLGKRKSYSKKAKKNGKEKRRERTHMSTYRWQRIWQNIAASRAISRFVFHEQTTTRKKHKQRDREKGNTTKENIFGAAMFFKRIFFGVISLVFGGEKK